jgi:hypothetical protein
MSTVTKKQMGTVNRDEEVLEFDSHGGTDQGKAMFFGDKAQNYR